MEKKARAHRRARAPAVRAGICIPSKGVFSRRLFSHASSRASFLAHRRGRQKRNRHFASCPIQRSKARIQRQYSGFAADKLVLLNIRYRTQSLLFLPCFLCSERRHISSVSQGTRREHGGEIYQGDFEEDLLSSNRVENDGKTCSERNYIA